MILAHKDRGRSECEAVRPTNTIYNNYLARRRRLTIGSNLSFNYIIYLGRCLWFGQNRSVLLLWCCIGGCARGLVRWAGPPPARPNFHDRARLGPNCQDKVVLNLGTRQCAQS